MFLGETGRDLVLALKQPCTTQPCHFPPSRRLYVISDWTGSGYLNAAILRGTTPSLLRRIRVFWIQLVMKTAALRIGKWLGYQQRVGKSRWHGQDRFCISV